LAKVGQSLLGAQVPSDLYVLALPLSQGHEGLALFAFLGGLSAATGMVVVSTLTLSLMIGNHWFAPNLLRGSWARNRDLRGRVLALRRAGIVAIMLLAWGYSRLIAGSEALADVGAVSFSALATLAPALAFAVWRPHTPPRAAIVGIAVGFAAWAWVLLLPMLYEARGLAPAWLFEGPLGWSWLAPESLFGLTGWSRLGRAVGASLFLGALATVLAAMWRRELPRSARRGLDAQTLRDAGLRFLPRERVAQLLHDAPAGHPVAAAIEAELERELAAVLGSSSARVLLDAARREAGRDLDTVAAIVGEASANLRFNQRVLEAALQNMSESISVVDAQLRLVAWNRRYAELFGYPPELLQVGRPIADLARWAMQRLPPVEDLEHALQRRLAFMRAGTAHLSERVFADGSIIEIRGNPMPGGGFVATFTDVTAFRRAEAGLIQANETLEQRVVERTADLQVATREAERANEAKSRFLAAVGHDLMQPLHAAQLFTDALAQQLDQPTQRETATQIAGALESTGDLLNGLLDMSRLQAGGLVPQPREFPLAEVLEPLASEFGAIAAARGLRFRYVASRAWTCSDPQLLRRVLQNFLANAVRYTASGRVLLGVRRREGALSIEVHDSGPGIEPALQRVMFEEFRRGDNAPGQGLGLGLSIADRIADLLHAPLTLHSRLGHGTAFAVRLPRTPTPMHATSAAHGAAPSALAFGLRGMQVLAVDNDPQALSALSEVLRRWGCEVVTAADGEGARRAMRERAAGLWLFDFHLDDDDTGLALAQRLSEEFGARPTLLLSADGGAGVRQAVHAAGLSLLTKPVKPLALKSVLDRLLAAGGVER
ncbi:MAG: PAS-domain containing protein, partial [Lysobacter sp.]|nr:PAS-domain containing protein [Lysobacter sp.]